MKILVPIKKTIDYSVKIRIKQDNSGVETDNVKMSINPFDEIAVEEALRLKEAGHVSEVIVVTVGKSTDQDVLRHALAMGADRAILVQSEVSYEPLNIAKILKCVVTKAEAELVIMGKQAIDDDCNQTGQMLAALLNWPQGTFASKVEMSAKEIIITQEVDGGLSTVALTLPALITTDLRLNEPRYIKLPNIMKAKTKPLDTVPVSDFGLELKSHVETLSVSAPPKRQAGELLESVDALVDKIQSIARDL